MSVLSPRAPTAASAVRREAGGPRALPAPSCWSDPGHSVGPATPLLPPREQTRSQAQPVTRRLEGRPLTTCRHKGLLLLEACCQGFSVTRSWWWRAAGSPRGHVPPQPSRTVSSRDCLDGRRASSSACPHVHLVAVLTAESWAVRRAGPRVPSRGGGVPGGGRQGQPRPRDAPRWVPDTSSVSPGGARVHRRACHPKGRWGAPFTAQKRCRCTSLLPGGTKMWRCAWEVAELSRAEGTVHMAGGWRVPRWAWDQGRSGQDSAASTRGRHLQKTGRWPAGRQSR